MPIVNTQEDVFSPGVLVCGWGVVCGGVCVGGCDCGGDVSICGMIFLCVVILQISFYCHDRGT